MRYRRLTATGDYVFGQGSLDYLSDADAAAQAVKTKLKLLLGEWWENTGDGLPLFQQCRDRGDAGDEHGCSPRRDHDLRSVPVG